MHLHMCAISIRYHPEWYYNVLISGLVKNLHSLISMKSTLLLLFHHSQGKTHVFMCMSQVRKLKFNPHTYLSSLAKQTAEFFYLMRDIDTRYEWTQVHFRHWHISNCLIININIPGSLFAWEVHHPNLFCSKECVLFT